MMEEPDLYMLRHASIFHDPLGEFTSRRKVFWYYPRGAWLQRLIDETFRVWHYGQYNFLARVTRRNDAIAKTICLGNFTDGVMRLCMLLEEDYTPYWKWLAAEFRKLPNVAKVESALSELSTCQDLDRQASLVESICRDMHKRLVEKRLVSPDPKGHPHPLFCARNELALKAGDRALH